jgi:hypothetical protein
MTVSAPSAGVRRRRCIVFQNRGSEVRTAGVSAQPGCIELTVARAAGNSSASSSASTTCMRLVCA